MEDKHNCPMSIPRSAYPPVPPPNPAVIRSTKTSDRLNNRGNLRGRLQGSQARRGSADESYRIGTAARGRATFNTCKNTPSSPCESTPMVGNWSTSVSTMSNSGRGTRYRADDVVPRPPSRVNRALPTAESDMTPGAWERMCGHTRHQCILGHELVPPRVDGGSWDRTTGSLHLLYMLCPSCPWVILHNPISGTRRRELSDGLGRAPRPARPTVPGDRLVRGHGLIQAPDISAVL